MFSSTATAFLNMTNTTVSPFILHAAESSDHTVRNVGLATILLMGLAIFCLRRPTPLNLFGTVNTRRSNANPANTSPANGASEVTPLVRYIQTTKYGKETAAAQANEDEGLQREIDRLLGKNVDDPSGAVEIEMTSSKPPEEFDLDSFSLTVPTLNGGSGYSTIGPGKRL